MAIVIYRDDNANAIFIEDSNGVQFLNSLQAIQNVDACSVVDLARSIDLVTDANYTDFEKKNGDTYGNNATDVCNALNTIFQSSGTSTTDLPIITSPTSINSVEGDVINYELIASHGVGFEWTNLPVGLTTVEGNIRKLIGGSNLSSGVYTPTMRALNYNGFDDETLTITIANPPYANTKSIEFFQNDYLDADASLLASSLGRSGNGSGATDAFSIELYFKIGTHTGGAKQTLCYFGGADHDNEGHVWMYYKGSEKALYLEYGSKNNYLRFKTANNSLVSSTWHHIMITYDGGTTGVASGDINNYYSRFKLFIDGVELSTTKSNNNSGWDSSINDDIWQVGKRAGGNDWMKDNCRVNQLSVFDSDQSANIIDIYNGGVPFDLETLATPPVHLYPMGDGDTYPTLLDIVGGSDFTMNSMTAVNIITDAP